MDSKQLYQPLSSKQGWRIVAGIGLAAALALGGWLGYGWLHSGPQSPGQVKRSIHKFLKKQTGKSDFATAFDFNLKDTVARRQTNVLLTRQQCALLQTNLAALQQTISGLRKEAAGLQEEERKLRRQVMELEAGWSEKQKRLAARQQELSNAQTNVLGKETNLAALKLELAPLQATVTNLIKDLAALQGATDAPTNTADRLAALKAKQQELKAAQRDLAARQQAVATRQAGVDSQRANLTAMQTNVAALQSAVAEADKDLGGKRAAWSAKQTERTDKETALAAKQAELKAQQDQLAAKQKELLALQREVAAREQELASRPAHLSRELRRQVNEAASYADIYLVVGQNLWIADRLLAGNDAAQQRLAVTLAGIAVEAANDAAQNPWLGARICEAYLWPNLERADPPDKPRQLLEQLLQTCNATYQRADESNNVIKNYQLMLRYVTNEPRADAARYSLAHMLELTGQWEQARRHYREIQHSNFLPAAEQGLSRVERKLEDQRKAKN